MSKYIKTKDGIYERMFPNNEHRISFDHKTIEPAYYTINYDWVAKKDVINQADTIKKLCDEFVVAYEDGARYTHDGVKKEVEEWKKFYMLDEWEYDLLREI